MIYHKVRVGTEVSDWIGFLFFLLPSSPTTTTTTTTTPTASKEVPKVAFELKLLWERRRCWRKGDETASDECEYGRGGRRERDRGVEGGDVCVECC
jgi:hypothetical protein